MQQPLSLEAGYDRIVLAVSRAAIDPAAWTSVLTEFGQLFPGLRSQIIGWDAAHENTIPQYFDGYPEEFVTPYVAHFQYMNAWIPGWKSLPVGIAVPSFSVVAESDLIRTEFYNDWVKPQEDMCGGGGVVLFSDATRNFMFGGNIPKKYQDRYEAAFVRMVARLTPLMQHALEANRMMVGLRLDALALRSGTDPDDAAIFVLGEGGALIFANGRGQALLDQGCLVRNTLRGTIRFTDGPTQARLEQALAAPPGASHIPAFPIGPATDAPLGRIIPLPPEVVDGLRLDAISRSQGPRAVLILRRQPTGDSLASLLRRNAGLTQTEAGIAVELADGLSLAEIADTRQVSIHTVRNQVKSALSKTGSHRQSDLVRLVERLRRGTGLPD